MAWTYITKFYPAVSAIQKIREDWQETDQNLVEAQTSVALMLADFCHHLGLDEEDRQAALGAELVHQLERVGVL